MKLLIVGGTQGIIELYERRVREMGLAKNIVFVGMQSDVRPYLWVSDALVLPSYYEVFPLVALEGAAAGLPLLVTPLNGVEEFLHDGANGIAIKTHDAEAISQCLRQFAELSATNRKGLGLAAQGNVRKYDPVFFAEAWSGIYREVAEWT
jgi:glycosyltransferase involved in cell wall biosynthesis